MKITNNTSTVDTRFIKRVCTATHQHLAKTEGKLRHWSYTRLTVSGTKVFQRNRSYSGHAVYNGTTFHFTLGPGISVHGLVWLAYHEMMHLYGYKHAQGCDPGTTNIDLICAKLKVDSDMTVPHKAPRKAALKPDVVTVRYARMLKRRTAWKAKLKRAENACTKLDREIHAYKVRHKDRL